MDLDKTIIYSSCLLLIIAKADDKLLKEEISIIEEIISDFFQIDKQKTKKMIEESLIEIEKSIDIYQFSKYLNETLFYQDKLDLIKCIFEVGYIDGELHHLEYHYIKSISNLLNVEKKDMISVKRELKKYI